MSLNILYYYFTKEIGFLSICNNFKNNKFFEKLFKNLFFSLVERIWSDGG